MSTEHNNLFFTISYLPNGIPAPDVMTEQEVAEFLRLDTDETSSSATLKYYRDQGLLKGTRIGKYLRYTRQQVLEFLDRLSGRTNKTEI